MCEDRKNPCINELLKLENVQLISGTLERDLSVLCNASNAIIGYGTFGFLIYLANTNLKNLYIPDYAYIPEFIEKRGNWGNNINLHVIDLPNYIKVGEWKNTAEQRKLMLNY